MSERRLHEEPVVGDAFGMALRYCYRKGEKVGVDLEVIERDDGYIDAGDVAEYFASYETMDELDHWLLDKVSGRVLDVGCGPGRHALYLQEKLGEKGVSVLGLDASPGAIEVASERGVRETFIGTAADLLAFAPPPFETLLMMGHNLGLLESRERAAANLDVLARLLAPGGRLLGRGADPHVTGDEQNLRYYDLNRRAGRLPGTLRLRVRYRHVTTPWFDWLFLSIDELEALLEGSAFRLVDSRAGRGTYAVVLART